MPRLMNRPILLEDLRLCQDPAGLLNLFSLLGYTVEPRAVSIPKQEIGFAPADMAAVRAVYLLAEQKNSADFLQIVLFELETTALGRLRSLARNFLERGGNYLFVATADFAPTYRRLIFINPRRETGQTKIRKLVVDTIHPTRHDVDILSGLVVKGQDPLQLFQAQCASFDVERITNRFYQEYAALFKRTAQALQENNKGIPAFYDLAERNTHTQRLLGRMMFLYFIQKKGWLAGDPRFLTNQYARAAHDESNYYLTVLEPLFFETLNQPRENHSSPWGRIPYLNGGLFERDTDRQSRPIFNLYLPNDLFDPAQPGSVLAFFNNYNFTVAEETPIEQEVAVDPEMLGKVFENMMEEQERGKSGTFYTPRPIVHYMCRQALLGYLGQQTNLPKDLLQSQFDLPDSDDTTLPRLSVAQSRQVERSLDTIKLLDPAVGTGAFLVGMLQELIMLKRACHLARGVTVPRSSSEVAGWKRDLIANALYGVDIKRRAIEIARLRLWLSLVVDIPDLDAVEPLPNLDYKLMSGNSLIETFEGEAILPHLPEPGSNPFFTNSQPMGQAGTPAPPMQLQLGMGQAAAARADLARLKQQFFHAQTSDQRRDLRGQIEEQERNVLQAAVSERLADLHSKITHLTAKGAVVNWKGLKAEQKQLDQLAAKQEKLLHLRAHINSGEPLPFFLYHLHFFEVFRDKGGFDIVIANPPYVNTKDTTNEDKEALENNYGWSDDLYAHFIFKGFSLAKQDGWVAYITSDSFFTITTKKRVRELLQNRSTKLLVQCDPFNATVDAAIFLATNSPASKENEFIEFIQARQESNDIFDSLEIFPDWKNLISASINDTEYIVKIAEQNKLQRYLVPLNIYTSSLNLVFFEPSKANIVLYNSYMPHLIKLSKQWWDKIKDSRRFSVYLSKVNAYCKQLKPGDITLVGLLAEGGVGMQTGDNGRFLGYLEKTPQAKEILERRNQLLQIWNTKPIIARELQILQTETEDFGAIVDLLKQKFDWKKDLELNRGEIYRIIKQENIFDVSNLLEKERQQIISEGLEKPRCWLPYRKGDKAGNKWVSLEELYILWDKDSAKFIQSSSYARWQGYQFFLTEGITWSDTANHSRLKARLHPICFFDVKSMRLTPTQVISAKYFLALLNADLIGYISKKFFNNTAMYQIGDLRMIPLVIPTKEQHDALEKLSEQSIQLQIRILQNNPSANKEALEAELLSLQLQVNYLVEQIYNVGSFGPFDNF